MVNTDQLEERKHFLTRREYLIQLIRLAGLGSISLLIVLIEPEVLCTPVYPSLFSRLKSQLKLIVG